MWASFRGKDDFLGERCSVDESGWLEWTLSFRIMMGEKL